jgi:hypothetical protein
VVVVVPAVVDAVVVVPLVVVDGAVVVVAGAVVVAPVVVESVVVEPVVVVPAVGAPHVPDGSWSQTSPLAIRCFAAWTETLIRTHFVALPVLWQSTTLPVEGSVAGAVGAAGAAPPLPLPWPLPGGGFAIAIEATRPATKSASNRAFGFMREVLLDDGARQYRARHRQAPFGG